MGYQANSNPDLWSGVDPRLIDASYSTECEPFFADVNETQAGEGETQNEGLPPNFDRIDSHSTIGLPRPMLSGSGNASETASRAVSSTASPPCRRTRARAHRRASHHTVQPVSSESSDTTCDICQNDPNCNGGPSFTGTADSQKSSLRRHKREAHGDDQNSLYQCTIDKDGSPCGKIISRSDNRRRHVETAHPTKAMELPQKEVTTRKSSYAKVLLDQWIPNVPQST